VAARLALQLGALEREELHVLLLNTRNVVIDQVRVYQGNVGLCVVRVGELFAEAVRRQAPAVLLVHNHPSGDPTPSPDDLHLTAEAIAAGRLLDISVLDHIVIGGGTFVSLRERGVSFERPEPGVAGDQQGDLYSTWNTGASSATSLRPRRRPAATGWPSSGSATKVAREFTSSEGTEAVEAFRTGMAPLPLHAWTPAAPRAVRRRAREVPGCGLRLPGV